MVLIVNRYLISGRFVGLTIYPFVILKEETLKTDQVFLNHESIHLRQQLEMGILPFFVWYSVEFIIRYLRTGNAYTAYRAISFEQEAYTEESNGAYLQERKFWAFLRFI
ncbi:hypothetical protein [Croceiramulus getboli]|nr:hypothetical protein P8624_02570 [Flavobacteriaceae bacterium YJPT1-3]